MRYVGLIFKNSLRNRRRSLLTILSIGASLCLLGVMFALYRGLFLAPPAPGQELRLVTHHKVSITQPIPAYFGDKIRQLPGVREAMIWQWFGGTYKDARDQRNFFARFPYCGSQRAGIVGFDLAAGKSDLPGVGGKMFRALRKDHT